MIVGLGNPEKKYEETRHNVGFKLVDKLCERFGTNLNEHKFHSLFTGVNVGEEKIILAKPLTYMNNSGLAVREISNYFKIDIGDIYVVYDDISIDVGSIRIRKKGSAGGHNGIKSISIFYDYEGIQKWCNGDWKAKKEGTKRYVEFYKDASKLVDVDFIKVKGHSGDKYNDLADELAKKALGLI